MADAEEDFSKLPLPDRFVHKNWKVRKEGYEAATKEFDLATSERDDVVRQFINDASIWKGVVGDSNVAAQQEGLKALCSFLQIAGTSGCQRYAFRDPEGASQVANKHVAGHGKSPSRQSPKRACRQQDLP